MSSSQPRTDASTVKEIFETELTDSTGLNIWIGMASSLVDDINQAANDAGNTLSDSRLMDLETLLSAHFASAQDPRIAEGDRETGSVTYQGETGLNLSSTKYGQNAMLLDPTGTLAALNGDVSGDEGGTLTRNSDRNITITGDDNG